MNVVPVSSSIIQKYFVGEFISSQYDLDVIECSLLKAGINHSYLVQIKDAKFVFRIYSHQWRTHLEISEEIRLLNLLHEHKVSVSYPISDHSDQYIQSILAPEGERFAVLFSFAKGEKLQVYPEELHFKIGQLMARFHRLSKNIHLERINYTPKIILQNSLDQIAHFLPKDSEEFIFLQETQQTLLGKWNQIDTTKVRQGAVHLDIWFDNLNIAKSSDITLFDFDFCGNGFLTLDVAYYILQVTNIERDNAIRTTKTQQFLDGYESITPLSNEEKRIYPMLGLSLYFFYMGVQCQRFDDWSNVFLHETYLKRYINLLVKRYADLVL